MRCWFLLLLVACAAEPVDLVDHTAWRSSVAQDDPLTDHRPDDTFCPVSAWGPEDGALEIQTGLCRYAALVQPLTVDLRGGDVLTGDVWHADLDAAEPATGHVAILVGDVVVWEQEVAIPGDADTYGFEVVLPAEVRDAEEVGVHLHNHGWNSWKVGEITAWR